MNTELEFHRVVSDDSVSLAVTLTGSRGDTGFLFLHGILQSALSWKYQLSSPELVPWKSVAFDLRGHGFSSKPVGAEYYGNGDLWSRDVAAVLDATGLKRVILVGWSFGGRVILDHLERHGNDPRIAGLVFIDANTKTAPGHISEECVKVLGATVSEDMAENIAARHA
ncbi:MAG: alpha/beta hydrolase, partial [Rhodospirillum sp.]|nr:alpha/beta hydrolase [Rhodospirillum sp.]